MKEEDKCNSKKNNNTKKGNMENNLKKDQLIELVSRKSGINKEKINMETSIEQDLGVTGEDAEELIKEISKKFKVNIDDFVFAKYFNNEPSILTVYREVVPLTVGDLIQAISNGKLV